MAKNNNKLNYSMNETFSNIASGITGFIVFVVLAIFPLWTHNMYFDILSMRYLFFKILVILLLILLSALGIVYLFVDNKNDTTNQNGSAFNRLANFISPPNFIKHITITDIFFIIMIISMSISTINSQFREESYYGNAGRYQGLECWILYIIFYFLVTRTFKYKRVYLDFAIIAGSIASLWGITDYFYLNLFHFFDNVNGGQRMMFASSIGNLNTFTNYTIMMFAISASLFMIEKNTIKSVFYGICALINVLGSVFGLSDNTILGFAAFYIMMPFLLFKNKRSIVRFFILCSMFFFGITAMHLSIISGHTINPMGSLFKDLSKVNILNYAFVLFLLIAIVLHFIYSKKQVDNNNNVYNVLDEDAPKIYIIIWTVILIISTVLLTYMLYDINVAKNHMEIWKNISFLNQLQFNDNWGTHRGYNWRIALINFNERFNIFQKLFGHGPDTYLIVTETSFYDEMVQKYNEIFDSAHNEFINYLICEGIIGLVSYVTIFISAIVYGIKVLKENIDVAALILCVVAYFVQALVNIAIPITTPIYFVSMYMIMAVYFNSEHYKNKLNYNESNK